MEAAKKDACLKAIEDLHKLGALNDYLLPQEDNATEDEPMLFSSDSDSYEGQDKKAHYIDTLWPFCINHFEFVYWQVRVHEENYMRC